MWVVEYRLRPGPMIVRPRRQPWRRLKAIADKQEAAAYASELRAGAKEAALPYLYRVIEMKGEQHA